MKILKLISIFKKMYLKISKFLYYSSWIFFVEKKVHSSVKIHDRKVLFSIIMPTYNSNIKYLRKAIKSVLGQTYENFELLIIDDASNVKNCRDIVQKYSKKDKRIRYTFKEKKGGISSATNEGLCMSTGDYIGFLDHDDLLSKYALEIIVHTLGLYKNADIVYSDEDKISPRGIRYSPYFKPDWSPDLLLCKMYMSHFCVLSRRIIKEVGVFNSLLDGAQDYDFILRATEQTKNIIHISHILYHWRSIRGSTARKESEKKYIPQVSAEAVMNALKRRTVNACISRSAINDSYYFIKYFVPTTKLVTIVINGIGFDSVLVQDTINELFFGSKYVKEVIVLSEKFVFFHSTEDLIIKVKIVKNNYSNEIGGIVRDCLGELILFLDGGCYFSTKDWLDRMMGFACQGHVGAVSPVILNEERRILFAGGVLGAGKVIRYHHAGYPENSAGENVGQLSTQANYSVLSKTCFLFEKKKIKEINQLSKYFNEYYWLSIFLELIGNNYYNVVLSDVKVVYKGKKSAKKDELTYTTKKGEKELDSIMVKWGRFMSNDPFYNPNLSTKKIDYSLFIIRRK